MIAKPLTKAHPRLLAKRQALSAMPEQALVQGSAYIRQLIFGATVLPAPVVAGVKETEADISRWPALEPW